MIGNIGNFFDTCFNPSADSERIVISANTIVSRILETHIRNANKLWARWRYRKSLEFHSRIQDQFSFSAGVRVTLFARIITLRQRNKSTRLSREIIRHWQFYAKQMSRNEECGAKRMFCSSNKVEINLYHIYRNLILRVCCYFITPYIIFPNNTCRFWEWRRISRRYRIL